MTIKLLIYLFLTITFTKATVIVQSNKRVLAPAESSGPHLFYIKESEGLLQSSSSNYLVTGEFESAKDALALDYHHIADLLFWSTRSGKIYSCKLALSRQLPYVSNPKLFYSNPSWLPSSLAIDFLANRLYILDTLANNLRLFDVTDNKNSAVLDIPAHNFKPIYLEIDPHPGYVFLMDHGEFGKTNVQHILRMNMDSSDPKFIEPSVLTRESIIGKIALDRSNQRILVSSVLQRKILSMNYDGGDLRTILAKQAPISMSVVGNELFWINAFKERQGVAKVDGTGYKCIYDPVEGCKTNSTMKLTEEPVILAIKVVEPTDQKLKTESCRNNCKHLCFNTGSKTSCGCKIGWQIDENVDCRTIDEFLIYEDDSVIRAVCSNGNRCMPFAPFHAPFSFKKNERTGFDYDPSTRRLYIGGKEAIYQVDLDSGARKRLLYQKDVFFGPLALDRASKNLYYTEIEQRGNVSFYIFKVMQAGPGSAERAEASSSLLWELGAVNSIDVHSRRGYVYATVYNFQKRYYDVWRFQTDAKNATILLGLRNASLLSVDEIEDRIYVFDSNSSEVRSGDLDGRGVRRITNITGEKLTGLLAYSGVVYVQNSTSLRRIEAASGKNIGEIDLFPYNQRMMAGVKLHVAEKHQTEINRNPCNEDNGGCDNFCFAVPRNDGMPGLQKVCRCFDGVKCAGLVPKNSTY